MGELAGADVVIRAADLEGVAPTETMAERNVSVMPSSRRSRHRASSGASSSASSSRRSRSSATSASRAIELVRNVLDENERAVATDVKETLECGLVFRSVGYRGVELPGVPFDDRSGTIANESGRVGEGVYCAGWIKRGPSGVIGTNKKDATETVEALLADVASGRLEPKPGASAAAVDALLAERGVRVVEYAGWTAIDEVERAAGEKSGRPRVKLCSWDELSARLKMKQGRPAALAGVMRRPQSRQ